MTRDARRALLREAVKEYERSGFNPARLATVFGLTRQIADILNETADMRRISSAGAAVLKAFETSAKRYGYAGKLPCQKGCSYCCHARVTATVPEIFTLARAIRERWKDPTDPLRAHFEKVEALTRPLLPAQWAASRVPCALLVDNACSAYEARPLTCRGYGSLSLAACVDNFNLVSPKVPQPDANQAVRSLLLAGLIAALQVAGLDSNFYELGHGLQVALEPGAEARWLKGEPVFAGVAHEVRTKQEASRQSGYAAFNQVVDVIKAAAFGKDVPPNSWFAWPA